MLERLRTQSAQSTTSRPLAIVSRGMSAGAGGLEMFNANLVKALQSRADLFVAPHAATSKLKDYASRLAQTIAFLRRHRQADVLVQYGSFLDVLVLPVLHLFSSRIRVIAHVSDSWVHVRNPALFALTRLILKSCTQRLFVLADQQASVFAAVRPVKIHTVVGSAFAAPSANVKREGFAFIGRVVAEKGILDLLAAWDDQRIRGRRLTLRVYGRSDAQTLARIEAEIARLRLGDVISLEGSLQGDSAVIAAMERAQALLYPTYADAFPLVMIESFARGTPCLVSTVGEGRSFVGNADLVVEPGDIAAIADAVIRLADGRIAPDYLAAMQEKARRYASAEIVADLERHGAISLGDLR